jgi:lysozyme
MNYDKERLVDQLIRHEGMELKVYKDSLGIETIGIGRNLVDRGVTEEEARYLCNNDIEIVERELVQSFPIVSSLNDTRIRVLLDMAFNVGLPRLRGFKRMWAALENNDYGEAAKEMLDSKWARQVKTRAYTLARMMESGEE